MRLALEQAGKAFSEDEVPVGAVVVKNGAVLSAAHNTPVATGDRTAHAELLALREAAAKNGGLLSDCTLYVTLEPCAMCAGAALNLKLGKLVFGAYDAAGGCCASVCDLSHGAGLWSFPCLGGVLETEAKTLLSEFFQKKRCKPQSDAL